MRAKNYTYYSKDPEVLKRLGEEYRFIGRECKVYDDRVVVFALPRPKRKAAKAEEKSDRPERYTKRQREYDQ